MAEGCPPGFTIWLQIADRATVAVMYTFTLNWFMLMPGPLPCPGIVKGGFPVLGVVSGAFPVHGVVRSGFPYMG